LKDQDQYVASIEASLSPDGHIAQLHFIRSNGMTTFVNFPRGKTASLMANLEQVLGPLVPHPEACLREAMTVAGPATRVESVCIKADAGGNTLSFLMTSGMRFDLALGLGVLKEAIACMDAMAGGLSKPAQAALTKT
jgi:hypothetical protein